MKFSSVQNFITLSNNMILSSLGLPGSVSIYGCLLSEISYSSLNLVTIPDALAKASEKRLRDFRAGRYCAIRALTSAGYVENAELKMDVDGLPQWPSEWLGSISHNNSFAIAAVSRRTSCSVLGIDIEAWIDENHAADIETQIAHPDELFLLRDFGLTKAVTLIFSAKESLYKALYPLTRKFVDFTAARLISASESKLYFVLFQSWGTSWPRGCVLPVSYFCCQEYVCTALWQPATGHEKDLEN